MNTAARSITRMGLHKRGTYELDDAQANDYRTVFAASFYSEKWACLCHGNPSTLAWGLDAIEIAAGMKEASHEVHRREDALANPPRLRRTRASRS